MSTPIELNPHITGDWWDGIPTITYKINGSPVDITNATIKMHVKKDRKTGSSIIDSWSTEDNTITIIDALEGKFAITGKIINWVPGVYVSDIEVTIDAKPKTIIPEIVWTINPDITR